jgi:hypothetical protein
VSGPSDLPAGLAEPLHLLPPGGDDPLLPALLLLLLLVALLVGSIWRRRRRFAAIGSRPAATGPAPTRLTEQLRRLHHRHRSPGRRRLGCHRLSQLARRELEPRRRRAGIPAPFSTLTAREVAEELGDGPAADFLRHLAGLQFGRQPPRRDDYDAAFELAEAVLAPGGKR